MYRAEYDPTYALPNPYYWAGNEEDLLSPFLFNYAGRMDLTSQYVKYIKDNVYTPLADGLPGNDDYGTMSAWYIWAALGLYPKPASTEFILTSPTFEEAVVTLPNSKTLTVKAYNFDPSKSKVVKVAINGKEVSQALPLISWTDIVGPQNSLLEFWMK